jgi:multisubunit Na+/H+ antiporter MnhF subunit
MADLRNGWSLAALALFPAFCAAVIASGLLSIPQRLIAIQLATSLSVLLLVVLSFVFAQPSSLDLALSIALLTLPGTLLFALFLERWL